VGSCSTLSQSAPTPKGWFLNLTPASDTGVAAQVLIHENGHQWMVMVTVQGLEPNSRHTAHVRDGSCAGAILYPLDGFVADATGAGHSETDLDATPDATWWIQVDSTEGPSDQWVAWGQVLAD